MTFVLITFLFSSAQAAEPVPGDACGAAGATMASNNSGVGHFMLCQGGTWKAVYSYNATGALTKIGNLSCASGEILKWNGSVWACAADDGADNLGNHTATATLNMNSQAISGAATISATGKISTTGIVKVGTQAACAAADAGSMRYAGGSAPWEYCDGGGTWRPFRQPRCQNDGAGECYLASPRSGDDPEFASANIRCGINILGVTGTLGDTTPDLFSFTDQTGVAISTILTSNTVTVTGMDPACGAVPVTVSGSGAPQIKIGSGSWGTSGTISNGQTLQVQLTSSGSYETLVSATVTVGTLSDQWDVTTKPDCNGVMVDGYCWYAGGFSQNCDTVCAGHGGCNLNGVIYAGSGGTNAICVNILQTLGMTTLSAATAGTTYKLGCSIVLGMPTRYDPPTTCNAIYLSVYRACACNN